VAELLRFLISLINPNDRQNMPTQISMGLNMLVIAMETGAPHLQLYPTLMEVR
jgi:brefeldin A-resistance guanine nucleotide exchange factor 1